MVVPSNMISNRLKTLLPYLALAAAVTGAYILAAAVYFRAGFPLDDAWIHQAYARSLALHGSWSFQRGIPSAGSTSPLWSVLLSAGYLLRLQPAVWSGLLGALALAGLAWTSVAGLRALAPGRTAFAAWAGVLVVLEWHLAWSAASGMETLLFALMALALLVDLAAGRRRPFVHGLLAGAAVWVRPAGLTLLGPLGVVLVLSGRPARQVAGDLLRALAGVLLLFVPYLAFNFAVSGHPWPSTLFAKQAEYAALRELPFLQRLGAELGVSLVGVGMVLLPGVGWLAWTAARDRRWGVMVGLAWAFGMAALYAWRLPATYQHGRYMIPIIPIWLVWGLAGMAGLARPASSALWPRVLSRAWLAATGIVLAAFFILGMQAYARDVSVIESEMVATAHWVADHLPLDARIAAHDIGALGYFGDREILDLAGLVTPEVIPFLRDETALRDYLDHENADYLVTLESWYPELESGLEIVYRTGAPFSPALGGTNMVVYRWSK